MTPPGCGRPARAEAVILQAALDELAANGFAGLTMERIASSACVGRATIYRHWRSCADLIIDAMRTLKPDLPLPDTGSLRGDLLVQVGGYAHALSSTPFGTILPALVDAAQRDPELAELHSMLIHERRAKSLALLARGVERGELPGDVDDELLLDRIVGPIFYRHLVLHRATSPDEVEALIDAALIGVPR